MANPLPVHQPAARASPQSAPARIVNVSSTAHYDAPLDFNNLQGERTYNGVVANKIAKLGNVLFTM